MIREKFFALTIVINKNEKIKVNELNFQFQKKLEEEQQSKPKESRRKKNNKDKKQKLMRKKIEKQ